MAEQRVNEPNQLRLPPTVAAEINALNRKQRAAVVCLEDATVLAGPGSGKTRVLVAKAAYLSASCVQAPQRVACITYGNQAAVEIRSRLRSLTQGAGRAVAISTVHGFCLSEVLMPFSKVSGHGEISAGAVLSDDDRQRFRASAYQNAGLYEDPTYTDSRDISCRRTIAAEGDLSRFSSRVIAAAKAYDKLLVETGRLDFESMVGRSLEIFRAKPAIAKIVATKFPWLLVDEYQDLGPVLHCLVTILRDAGARIFAVGDPDQSILGFTGSDPKCLLELGEATEKTFHLSVNYRSGRALVAACSNVLGVDRGYESRDGAEEGLIDYQPVSGGIERHAERTGEVVADLLAAGVEPHDIAVLYSKNRKRVPVRNWLEAALRQAAIPLLAERAVPWPSGTVIRFLQRVATWQLDRTSGLPVSSAYTGFDDLVDEFLRLYSDRPVSGSQRLPVRVTLWRCLSTEVRPDMPLRRWSREVIDQLGLRRSLRRSLEAQELVALSELQSWKFTGVTLAEFSGDAKSVGKVRLTTYYSAKGREWTYVVLPYLQEAIAPDWPLDYGRPYLPSEAFVEAERRVFYVALSRAKQAAVLVYTPDGFTGERAPIPFSTPSRFLWNLPDFPD
ncbi:ATP-dependent helicase [Micromonospora sp. STR1_7]|uniref:DNA 3'-5' helicase n=1 Tax=Micromonospora parastrephiae TaxID=2806101 RepID=A0ABS1XQ81_9ACTN|nr:ATP-dependent helicase [Micromonospora parastrephiae]MBM0231421.1 ATP-dependent helicase [Micromonospora parastrephiae]